MLTITLVLEIISDALEDDKYYQNWTLHFNLKLAAYLLSFLTDESLVFLLWAFLIYFFRKKKQFLSKSQGQFTQKEKVIITWLVIVIALNSFNIAVDNIVDITFHFIANWYEFEDFWRLYMHFWFDMLVLNNGMTMLFLYKHMACI